MVGKISLFSDSIFNFWLIVLGNLNHKKACDRIMMSYAFLIFTYF